MVKLEVLLPARQFLAGNRPLAIEAETPGGDDAPAAAPPLRRTHKRQCIRHPSKATGGDDIEFHVVAFAGLGEERNPFMLRRPPHDKGDDLKSDVVAPRVNLYLLLPQQSKSTFGESHFRP